LSLEAPGGLWKPWKLPARLGGDVELSELIDSLARHGVDEGVIAEAMAEVKSR